MRWVPIIGIPPFLHRLKAVKDAVKERESHILQVEVRISEAETNIDRVKAKCSNVVESLSYAQTTRRPQGKSVHEGKRGVRSRRRDFKTKHLLSAMESYLLSYSGIFLRRLFIA